MSDQPIMLTVAAVTYVSAIALALLLGWLRKGWSKRRVALLSALPVPGVIGLLLIWVIAHTLYDSFFDPESCGVDACGMAMGISMIGLFAVVAIYCIGVGLAALAIWLLKR